MTKTRDRDKKIQLNLKKKVDSESEVLYLSFTELTRGLGQQGIVEVLSTGKKVYLSIPNSPPIRLELATVD